MSLEHTEFGGKHTHTASLSLVFMAETCNQTHPPLGGGMWIIA